MTTRNDSFKSLTHKLEGEGKSAHYAQAIAGKVAKEKRDIGKKDAQEKGDPWSDQNTRHDASETSGGRTISNKTIRRHAARLRRVAQYPGQDNPKSAKTSNTQTRREAALNHLEAAASTNRDDDLDPDHIKHDLDTDRHEDADRAVEKSIERHARKRTDEDAPMADKSEMRKRLDEIMSQVKDLCDELGDDDDTRDDAESEAERSAAGKVARRHQLETERDDAYDDRKGAMRLAKFYRSRAEAHRRNTIRRAALGDSPAMVDMERDRANKKEGAAKDIEGYELDAQRDDAMSHAEHVRIGKESHRDDEDEHKAGEELAEGHEDVGHGDKAKGEELEHEAGEAEAEDRDHGDDGGGDGGDGGDDVREHRGDQAPEDVAESVTEADAQSSRRSVGVKRSFNNRHDSNEERDMTQRSDEDIRRRIDVLDARLKRATRPASYKERDELSRIRARCDSVAQALGVRPEAPLPGEFPDEYRRRCAALLQPFSQSTKGVSIGRLDDAAFKVVEDRIYADAQSAAREPIKSLAGRLVPVESHDAAGRTITKYYGDPKAWMRPYMAPGVHIRFADSATRRNTGAR